MRKTRNVALLVILSIILSAATIWAATTNPGVYFTDNMNSTGTSPDIQPMEQVLLNRINGASISIDAAIYDFNRDSIRDALIAAHNRGVTVRMAADDEARTVIASYIPYYNALESASIPIVDDNREQSIMHNKYFIFDGQMVWSGSVNMSDNGFTKNHNNGIVFTSTAVAQMYQADFDQMMAGNFSVNKSASITTSTTYNGKPLEIYFSPKDNAMDEVIAEVNAAQISIDFAIFFFTDDGLRDALIAAKGRGVQIRGLWDLLGAASPFSDDEALCNAGIPIKIEDTIGKMHHKFMTIDATGPTPKTITGSMNWTNSGDNANDENTLIIHDGPVALAYAAGFQTMWDALDASTQCQVSVPHAIFLPFVIRGDNTGTTLPPADVKLTTIVYNPDGDDVDGEHVELENKGGTAQDMTSWTLNDEASTTFTFPSFSLQAGATVKVWVKAGTDTTTDLFWGRGSAVWNNGGDTATLRDDTGASVDVCGYFGGESVAWCQ